MALLASLSIGLLTGLRSLTTPAVTAWAAYLGWLALEPPLALVGAGLAVGLFTAGAIGELVLDKLPSAPNRTDALGLVTRFSTGALTGACVASAGGQAAWLGAALGAAGGIAGCFAGYRARLSLTRSLGPRGWCVAPAEDLLAIAGSLLVVSLV